MAINLHPGIELIKKFTVTDDMAPPHLPVKVLSTPSMILMIEMACRDAVQRELGENETTVGTHVNVSHDAPANSGDTVSVHVKLIEVQKRRLLFEVRVEGPKGVLSTGTHQRAVVDTSRMTG